MKLTTTVQQKAKRTVAVSLIVAIGAVYWFKSHNRLSVCEMLRTSSCYSFDS